MYDTTGRVRNKLFETRRDAYRLKSSRQRSKLLDERVVNAAPQNDLVLHFVREWHERAPYLQRLPSFASLGSLSPRSEAGSGAGSAAGSEASTLSTRSLMENGHHELRELVHQMQHKSESELADLRGSLYREIQALFRLLHRIEERVEEQNLVNVHVCEVSNVGTSEARLLTSLPVEGPEIGELVAFEVRCQIRGPVVLEMLTVPEGLPSAPVRALSFEWTTGPRIEVIKGHLINRYTGIECACLSPEPFVGTTRLATESVGFLEFWASAAHDAAITLLEVSWYPAVSVNWQSAE